MKKPTGKKPAHYLDREVLAQLVRDYQTTGVISDDLARSLVLIAGGVWDRYRYTADRDDFIQDVVTHLLQRPLQRADAQKHVFNFMTTCAIRYGWKLRDKAAADTRRFQEYAGEVARNRPVPGDEWRDDVSEEAG